MSEDWRAEARALCEAATDGPWVDRMLGPHGRQDMRRVMEGRRAGSTLHGTVAHTYRDGSVGTSCTTGKMETEAVNALFIAHARTALPRALDALDAKDAEIARLRGLLDEGPCIAIDKALAHAHSSIPDFLALEEMRAHLEAVRAENVALRARLAWFEECLHGMEAADER